MSAQSDEELKEILTTGDFSFRFDCGYNSPITAITCATREEFVNCIGMHYCIYGIYAELTQLRSGLLDTLRFDRLAREHPVALWSLLALSKSEQVTSAYLQDLFDIAYSPQGSNLRAGEERAVMFFYNYLQECEGK